MLEVQGVSAGYEGTNVLDDVSLSVAQGQVVCVLGANGAGKSTLAKVIGGLVRLRTGTIRIGGTDVSAEPAHWRRRRRLALVPEGRHLFNELTVRDNLLLGGVGSSRVRRSELLETVVELFPALEPLLGRRASLLSGGEQQMLAIGRALMGDPEYVVYDEPSLGLAPIITTTVLRGARLLAESGKGVLLIEQNVQQALAVSDLAAVLEHGKVIMSGTSEELRRDHRVVEAYLGSGPE